MIMPLVINGADGVVTQTIWQLLALQAAGFLFINKMDQEGSDKKTAGCIKQQLDDCCIEFGKRFGKLEQVAMCDDDCSNLPENRQIAIKRLRAIQKKTVSVILVRP